MNELALFSGAGGGILGGKLLGWHTLCAVECEPAPNGILVSRQNDGSCAPFPIWDDVRTFDGRAWRGFIDVVTGGFPCQDISSSNNKAVGISGERSGLWKHMARIVGEVRPSYVLVENSPALTFRGLGTVLGDLAQLGYNASWGVLAASDAGLEHERGRIWVLAHTEQDGWEGFLRRIEKVGRETAALRPPISLDTPRSRLRRIESRVGEPPILGSNDGLAHSMEQLCAIGNGQCPEVVRLAWETLKP